MAECEYSLNYLPAAKNDIAEIGSMFVMLGNINGAKRIRSKIKKAVGLIQTMPYIGPAVHDKKIAKAGFRMYIIENYLMLYKVFEDEKKVLIYRVVNGKTDYPTLMNWLYN